MLDIRNPRRSVTTSNTLLKALQTDNAFAVKVPEDVITDGEIHTLQKRDLGPKEGKETFYARHFSFR
jgi:hypothetical protein